MAHNGQPGTDRTLEIVIGYTLRIGVTASALLVLAGGILYLAQNTHAMPDYSAFRADSTYSRTLSGIFENALALHSYGIIQLGLLVLVATPVLRVIFSVIAFALERDLLYVAATLFVLGVLLYSLFVQGM